MVHTHSSARPTADGDGLGRAHAKAILLGEHAVLYGAPAIALPVMELVAEARVTATDGAVQISSELHTGEAGTAPVHLRPLLTAVGASLERLCPSGVGVTLRLTSDIPHGRGLGSSAAVAAAVARAVADLSGRQLLPETLHEIVQEAERVAHGNPSGLDARTVVSGSAIRFKAGVVSPLEIGRALTFVLADSGASGSTVEAVGGVRTRRLADPVGTDALIEGLAELTEAARADLAVGDTSALGARMDEAHSLLSLLGVSTPALDALVASARRAGAPGAKLTGGGLGGCILALAASREAAAQLADSLRSAGAVNTWTTEVPAT